MTPITTAATVPAAQGASAGASPKRDSLGWGSSSDDDDHYRSRCIPTPWVLSSSQPPPPPDDRVPTTPPVSLPPGFQSPPGSDADSSLTGFRRVVCPLRLRIDEALSSYREDDRDRSDAWRTQQSCSASRHAVLVRRACRTFNVQMWRQEAKVQALMPNLEGTLATTKPSGPGRWVKEAAATDPLPRLRQRCPI